MKNLLRKEMKLAASPLSYVFLAFSLMALLPGYPILVCAFFICLGIFYSFQFGREYNDILCTALLPVPKRDVVTAKFAFVSGIQIAAVFLITVLTVLRMAAFSGAAAYTENALMNANLAFIGYVLIIFAEFNLVYLAGFFRTAYYIGKPFVIFCIVSFVTIFLFETLHHVPGLEALNSTKANLPGAIVLALGALIYISLTLISHKISQKRFETLDL